MTNNTIDYKTEYLKLKAQAEANEAFFYKKYKMPLSYVYTVDNIKIELVNTKESLSYQMEHEPEKFNTKEEPKYKHVSEIDEKIVIKFTLSKQNYGYGFVLDVDYNNKDLVKVAGAKWNNDIGKWYCPAILEILKKIIKLKDEHKCEFVKTKQRVSAGSFHDDGYDYEYYTTDEINELYKEYKKTTPSANIKPITKYIKPDVTKDCFESDEE